MVISIMNKIRVIINNKRGQGIVEYGLILGIISLGVIGAITTIAPKLNELFESIPSFFAS
jgi:pilus assembly protein Flp/PilA